ncbi:MAG: hypothetical protein IJI68_05655 [Eggerthellaceae bacterium]|nr:hypothetical protein [Eggerthellaceae bacterium]
MPLPLPIIGAVLVGGVIGACIKKMTDQSDVYQYDEEGYDSLGFDKDGFDRDGYNKEGFDKEGFGRDGLNRNGFDRDGRDKEGYDLEGFDADGRNRKGYDRAGWNADGRDVTGLDAAYYATNAQEIRDRLAKAEGFISATDYEHASLEIRKGAEQVVKCVISHTLGIGRYKRHFESDIDACKGALDDDLIGRLHTLRRTCGDQLHIDVRDVDGLQIDAKYVDNLQSRLQFCIKTLEETLSVVEGYASGN